MKRKNRKRILTGFVATPWMLTGVDVMGQGSLTPPGAPGVTMKTLEQVEPRTPISNLPYSISELGTYSLGSNLVSYTDGIIIQTNNVSVGPGWLLPSPGTGTMVSTWLGQRMR